MKNKKSIYIQDNFFEDTFFSTLQKEVLLLEFSSRFNDLDEISDTDTESNLATKYRAYRKIKAVSGEIITMLCYLMKLKLF